MPRCVRTKFDWRFNYAIEDRRDMERLSYEHFASNVQNVRFFIAVYIANIYIFRWQSCSLPRRAHECYILYRSRCEPKKDNENIVNCNWNACLAVRVWMARDERSILFPDVYSIRERIKWKKSIAEKRQSNTTTKCPLSPSFRISGCVFGTCLKFSQSLAATARKKIKLNFDQCQHRRAA